VSARPAKDAYLVAETVRLRRDLPMVDTVTTGRVPDLEGCCYIHGLLLRVQRCDNEVPGVSTGCVTPSHF
jgi:hypothetical protein